MTAVIGFAREAVKEVSGRLSFTTIPIRLMLSLPGGLLSKIYILTVFCTEQVNFFDNLAKGVTR